MADRDVALMAHLIRRAGFGAPYEEIEARAEKGYEATVDELVYPAENGVAEFDELAMDRFYPGHEFPTSPFLGSANFMYHMVTTPRPLEEKMALFWHMVFATGDAKVDNITQMVHQIDMFRRYGMGSYRELLVRLATDPAMIFWLDNNENHKDAPNENWGRELLELFSMGQGNYTEQDVSEVARAFTGWTIAPKIPGANLWDFEYRTEDHDFDEKEFLGERGRFNGEDVIDIIVRHPATARFIARHLYNFYVADDVQVPSWNDVPPQDPAAVDAIAEVLVSSNFNLRATLKFLLTSDFFKDQAVWFSKVRSPAEVVASTIRLIGEHDKLKHGIMVLNFEAMYQGQNLLNPPSVEGWHTGKEWIDGGSLVRRINFCADRLSDSTMPGIQSMISRLRGRGLLSPEELVDGCLELLGSVDLGGKTRQELIDHCRGLDEAAARSGEEDGDAFARRVTEVLQLIGAAKEYQFC